MAGGVIGFGVRPIGDRRWLVAMTRTMVRECLGCVLLLSVWGCGGKVALYEESSGVAGSAALGAAGGGTRPVAAAGSASTLGVGGAGGVGTPGSAGAGSLVDGGSAGLGSPSAGAPGAAGAPVQGGCTTTADCPAPPNACIVVVCVSKTCFEHPTPAAKVFVRDVPADCHATIACDGAGAPTVVVDQTNVPTPENPCLAGTCNKAGKSGTEALPAGEPCQSPNGGLVCDGAESCVRCLHSVECDVGQECSVAHECVPALWWR